MHKHARHFTLGFHYRNPGLCRVPASLPSAFSRALGKAAFAESRTRQSPALGNKMVYQVQDTRHRKTLDKDTFAEWQTLGKSGSRQRAVSDRSKADGRQPLPRAEVGTRQRPLYRVSSLDTRKAYFYFFKFGNQTFCGMLLHYVDLHVPFWDNYNRVFNR
jgi:hypothetical protein